MELLTKEQILFFKNNKEHITQELLNELRKFGNKGKQIALDILDLEKDPNGYYLDAFGERISFNGNRQLKKEHTKLKLSKIHLDEIAKCSEDFFYFLDNYLKITTPTNGINFPDLRDYQRDFLSVVCNRKNESIIACLPRQAGKSVSVGSDCSHQFVFEKDYGIGIAANKMKMAVEFIDKIKQMLLSLPIWLMPGIKTWNKTTIKSENGVTIMADTASDGSFRGFTVNKVVVDETAFIRKWSEFEDSVFPSQKGLSKKQTILISTPNGTNHFYDYWKDAHENEEYSNNGFIRFGCDWRKIPRFNNEGKLWDPDDFKESIIKKNGLVHWRQNYECEFMGSSTTLIDIEILKKYEAKEPIQIENPGLNIYEKPIKNHRYILAVDGAKEGEDAFAVQIVDITNLKFKQVASANLYVNYLNMPDFLDEWGRLYNHALMIIENNDGSGQSIADRMVLEYDYGNMYYDKDNNNNFKNYPGFRTTPKTRKQMLSVMKKMADEGKLEIVDKETINQFFSFVLINNKFQAENNKHDDLVMSMALIFGIFCDSKNVDDMKKIVEAIESKDSDLDFDVLDYINIGDFDSDEWIRM